MIFSGTLFFYVKWVPCHHCTARPHVSDGEERMLKAAASILSKQSWTADNGVRLQLGGWACG
jgi:hypothetical protein